MSSSVCPPLGPLREVKQQASPPRLRLEFLDGLRGLAALYVLIFHCISLVIYIPGFTPGVVHFFDVFIYVGTAHYAVDVFLILSGFCLMLPAARSADGRLPGGVWNYLGRRARRILPPFYVALVFSLLFPLVWQKTMHMIGRAPGESYSHLLGKLLSVEIGSPANLLAHLLMLHNLNPAWIYSYNTLFWSVAPEWDFYFLLPALLLPLWRRFGAIIMVWAAFLIGAAPHVLLPSAYNFDWTFPWYFGLFALGGAAAAMCVSAEPRVTALCRRFPWGRTALALFVLHAIVLLFGVKGVAHPEKISSLEWLIRDVVIGVAAMCAIMHCFQSIPSDPAERRPALLRLLESRWVVRLGAFSYSLYLTHAMFLNWPFYPSQLAQIHHLSPVGIMVVRCGIGIPVSLAFAYVFHLAFEKPFMTSPQRFVSLRAQSWMTKTFLFSSASKAREKVDRAKTPV